MCGQHDSGLVGGSPGVPIASLGGVADEATALVKK